MHIKRVYAAALITGIGVFAGTTDSSSSSVTFTKDILPILQANCQSCHRPGEIAPMSFLTYESTRPWAKAMKVAVFTHKMPPWFADPNVGHFSNDRTLKPSDIETIAKWADNGAPQGDPKDAPPAIAWPSEGWKIKPDYIAEGNTYTVPAHPPNNVIEWMTVQMPTGFTKDTWVTSIEIKPANLEVTHHICVGFTPHVDGVKYNVPTWTEKKRDDTGAELPKLSRSQAEKDRNRRSAVAVNQESGGCYVPGMDPQDYRPFHAARLIPANTDMVFSVHYTPNGVETPTKTEVGFTLATTEPDFKYVYSSTSSPFDADHFAIPPNNPNWESPPAEAIFQEDCQFVWMFPHMHFRGKDMTYYLVYPDGRKEEILNVPHYDFNWQLGYRLAQPIKVPKGTKLYVTAHFDNSVGNKFNPDPNRTVYYGDMTWEEMMNPHFAVIVDKNVDTKKVVKKPRLNPDGA